MEKLIKGIGAKIKQMRKRKKLTQAQLAKTIGMDVFHLSGIETGANIPSLKMLHRISEGLDEDFNKFIVNKEEYSRETTVRMIHKLSKKSGDKDLKKILKIIQFVLDE